MTGGTVPDAADFDPADFPYPLTLNRSDLELVARIVNVGIDSHLEAVSTKQDGRDVWIRDVPSMRCFIRRCVEDESEDAYDFASCVLSTLRIEWV
jgi:hypothetical protein